MRTVYMKSVVLVLSCIILSTSFAGAVDYSQVADSSEMTTVETVGIPGMQAILPSDIVDGVYEVQVESSSSMFQIDRAILRVENETMTADLTLSGTGYLVLYQGTAAEAAADGEEHYIGFTEDENGAYVYTVSVPALDQSFPCAAFSKRKEQWYDRSLLIRADSLPPEAVLVELPDYEALEKQARDARIEAMKTENGDDIPAVGAIALEDGAYDASVSLEGGTGKAFVESPARLTVQKGKATARIQWSSSHYDYMIVDGERYLPVNQGGNSVFEIPVAALDQPISVVADTTAMSTPHEISYTLVFSVEKNRTSSAETERTGWIPLTLSAVGMVLLGWVLGRKERNP